MSEHNRTHVLIEETVEQSRGARTHDDEPTVTRRYVGLYASEKAALLNAEAAARARPGVKFYVCEIVAVTQNAPHTTRTKKSGHPHGDDKCWGCSGTREEHPTEVGCTEWHGKGE